MTKFENVYSSMKISYVKYFSKCNWNIRSFFFLIFAFSEICTRDARNHLKCIPIDFERTRKRSPWSKACLRSSARDKNVKTAVLAFKVPDSIPFISQDAVGSTRNTCTVSDLQLHRCHYHRAIWNSTDFALPSKLWRFHTDVQYNSVTYEKNIITALDIFLVHIRYEQMFEYVTCFTSSGIFSTKNGNFLKVFIFTVSKRRSIIYQINQYRYVI